MPLSDLAAALAAATGPDESLDERLAIALFGWEGCADYYAWARFYHAGDKMLRSHPPTYTASLDAITGACERRWPNCSWACTGGGLAHVTTSDGAINSTYAATPSIALCLAAVRLAMAEEGK